MGRVVAVGLGGGGSGTALAWAVAETAAEHARLLLCHACPPDCALATAGSSPPAALLELVDPALARAVAGARSRLGGKRVALLVRPQPAHTLLLDAAQSADLLAIGRATGTGSLVTTLATHAPCPVVVARPTTGPAGPFADQLVVGLDGSAPSRAALEFAFGHADRHRCGLAAVHVGTAGDPDRTGDATGDGHDPAFARLAEQVTPWTHKYPDVPVQYGLFAGRPLPGLLRAAAGARLLLLGDHTRSRLARALLGSVSAGAVRYAPCATAVVRDWEQRR